MANNPSENSTSLPTEVTATVSLKFSWINPLIEIKTDVKFGFAGIYAKEDLPKGLLKKRAISDSVFTNFFFCNFCKILVARIAP
mgnify:CR=1 FL=1